MALTSSHRQTALMATRPPLWALWQGGWVLSKGCFRDAEHEIVIRYTLVLPDGFVMLVRRAAAVDMRAGDHFTFSGGG